MISTKGRYALRVMLDLAKQKPENYTPLKDIAIRQEISEKYLEVIIKQLVKEGLVFGVRGKKGGYKLQKSPELIYVGEIIEACEGHLAPVACIKDKNNNCPRQDQCETLKLWHSFDKVTHSFFYGITLSDVLNDTISIP